jgi:hypothetical protein
MMTDRQLCKRAVIQALQECPMTILELMRATGFSRDSILSVIFDSTFERVGTHRAGRGRAVIYRLRHPQPPNPLSPLERPVNPVMVTMLHNQLDMGRMIRRLCAQGEQDAAHALVKVWKSDDALIKRMCERSER